MRTLFNARLPMGRLPQLFGHAAVAAGLLAGGASLLNAGGAMAVACTPAGTFDVDPLGPDFLATCPLIPGGDIKTLAVDYDPAALLTGTGSYGYTVKTTPINPGPYFVEVGLGVDVNGIGTYSVEVMKDVFTADPALGGTFLGPLKFTQTNLGATYSGDLVLAPIYSSLYIKDTYSVTGTAVGIDKITNTFQTPGPLPILGAGAAFGFSRKLRGRIKAGRTA